MATDVLTYATVDDYRAQVPQDTTSTDELIAVKLAQQSAKLRGDLGITESFKLSADATLLAQFLVIDAVQKSLVTPSIDGVDEDLLGVTTTSMTANGFQQSYTLTNPSGSSYWDNNTLKALKRLLGRTALVGNVSPSYGA